MRPAFTVKEVMFAGNEIGGNNYISKPEDLKVTVHEVFKQGMLYVKNRKKYRQDGQGFNSYGKLEISIIAQEV